MFGLGGVYVEVFDDVAFRVAPLTREDAEEMIAEVKGSRLLRGIRGEKPSDVEAPLLRHRRWWIACSGSPNCCKTSRP